MLESDPVERWRARQDAVQTPERPIWAPVLWFIASSVMDQDHQGCLVRRLPAARSSQTFGLAGGLTKPRTYYPLARDPKVWSLLHAARRFVLCPPMCGKNSPAEAERKLMLMSNWFMRGCTVLHNSKV